MGAQATMSTTVNEAYSSSHNDQSIKVQLGVSWNLFGGGGSASTSKSHSEEYDTSQSTSTVQVDGGDPSLSLWPQTGEADGKAWQAWVDSVKTTNPSVVQFYVDDHSFLVEDEEKSAFLDAAVHDYLVKHNVVFPDADPTSYTLGLCDCQW